MIEWVVTFIPVCLATAFVCSCAGEDDLRIVARRSGKLFATLVVGVLVFCGVVQAISAIV